MMLSLTFACSKRWLEVQTPSLSRNAFGVTVCQQAGRKHGASCEVLHLLWQGTERASFLN